VVLTDGRFRRPVTPHKKKKSEEEKAPGRNREEEVQEEGEEAHFLHLAAG